MRLSSIEVKTCLVGLVLIWFGLCVSLGFGGVPLAAGFSLMFFAMTEPPHDDKFDT